MRILLPLAALTLLVTGCLSDLTRPLYEWNLDQVSGAANIWRVDDVRRDGTLLLIEGTHENRSGRLVEWSREVELTCDPISAEDVPFLVRYRRGGKILRFAARELPSHVACATILLDGDKKPTLMTITGPFGESWSDPVELRPSLTRRIAGGLLLPITAVLHGTFVVIDAFLKFYVMVGSAQGTQIPY